ncbi:undecaprenyl-diphosphate phosphatase, partial [bacterium]|nr:undecaprenyl-diphosphate phosphatase [bacterium]
MIETLLIAFIQGITEFIPVSSSLHIIIFSDFLGIEKNILNSVALHFGS